MSEKPQITPEEAYNKLLIIQGRIEEIEKQMKDQFEYSPFNYLAGKVQSELRDIRKKLIGREASTCRQKYTPNLKPNVDFVKLMNEKAGDPEFNPEIIEAWFKGQAQDKQQLAKKSLEQIISAVRSYVPYTSNGQPWGPTKNLKQLISGNILILRCFSWSAYNSISYHLNGNGEVNALEKLIDLVTLHGGDPATISGGHWISNHITHNRNEPKSFYGRHSSTHPAVQAFQFFKNDKLKIWFKRSEQAEAVAQALVNGALPQAPHTPLFLSKSTKLFSNI